MRRNADLFVMVRNMREAIVFYMDRFGVADDEETHVATMYFLVCFLALIWAWFLLLLYINSLPQ